MCIHIQFDVKKLRLFFLCIIKRQWKVLSYEFVYQNKETHNGAKTKKKNGEYHF